MIFRRSHHYTDLEFFMADLTQALADLAAAVANLQTAPSPTAALEAQVADLQAQVAAAAAAESAAGDQVEAAATAINNFVTPPAPPAPALPEYTYSGDPAAALDPSFTAAGFAADGTTQLYTYSGDTAGQPGTGDGADSGVWHLYTAPAA